MYAGKKPKMKKFIVDNESEVFRKFIPSEKFQNELEMSTIAYELGQSTDLFDSLLIKNIDSSKKAIEFELLKKYSTIREHYIKNAKYGSSDQQFKHLKALFQRLGKSLSFIHNGEAKFKGVEKRGFPKEFFKQEFENDLVYIHGDFTMRNILYIKEVEKLFIIDWNTSPIFDFSANYGPRYWDLSFFISSFYLFSFTTFFSYKSKQELVAAFLFAYLENSNIEKKTFLDKLSNFLKSYNYYRLYGSVLYTDKNFMKRMLLKYSERMLEKFIQIIPTL